MVAAFEAKSGAQQVAVKKCGNALHEGLDSMRVAREVQILRRSSHRNIVGMYGAYCAGEDVYIMQELMDTDLSRIVRCHAEGLTYMRCMRVMGEILGGVRYLHGLGVVHRDLKPSNVLVTIRGLADDEVDKHVWTVKLCDFNLARGGLGSCDTSGRTAAAAAAAADGAGLQPWRRTAAQEAADSAELSDYVCTRWYRAPEVVLLKQGMYGMPMDIWAVGCIWCEILTLKPFFPGKDALDQLRVTFAALGVPTEDDLPNHELRPGSLKVLNKLRAVLAGGSARPWSSLLPSLPCEARLAAEKLLSLDPRRRPLAQECVAWPCFAGSGSVAGVGEDEDDEEEDTPLDWSFDVPKPSRSYLLSLISTGDGNQPLTNWRPRSGVFWADISDDDADYDEGP
jgi:serine/threonine protein kinase